MLRGQPDELISQYATYKPRNLVSQKQGCPATSFQDHIINVINSKFKLTPDEIIRVAQERAKWKKLVIACISS